MAVFFFFNDTATTEIYTLSLHDALPIWAFLGRAVHFLAAEAGITQFLDIGTGLPSADKDRKSTRLNSSHSQISYAVFCLKKKKSINLLIFPSVATTYLCLSSGYGWRMLH